MVAFCDTVHGCDRDVVAAQGIGRATRGIQRKSDLNEFTSDGNQVVLVLVAHRQIGTAFGGHGNFSGQSGFEVSQIGPLVRTVDFACGFHLGPGCGVQASQLDEGENRGFDAHLAGGASRNVLLLQGLADGNTSSDAGKG